LRPQREAMPRFLRTNAFRLAALYFLLFAASVIALLAFVYVSTRDFIERQTEATIRAETRGLTEHYREHGLAGLIEVIVARTSGPQTHATLYLLADAQLRRVTGNLPSWPKTALIRPGWVSFVFQAPGREESVAEAAVASDLALPGGYRLLVGRTLRDARAFRARVDRTLAWSALITVALGVAGGLFMTRNMLSRVETVNRTSKQIIHGDLSRRVPLDGSGDEFDQLAANLNDMLDRIERLIAGMRDVTDNIAHDLRSPLSRLRARLEVTLLERRDTAHYEDVLRDTVGEADRLLGTFNALLKIAEAEAGSREMKERVDLAEIARSVAELYEPVAEEKGLSLTVTAPSPIAVLGDRHLLSQAISNLLDNAVKYTAAGGVALTLWQSGDKGRIEVADSGPGIPADRRATVFDRFVRLESSRSTPGNGLGLSLVRAVARMHGGEVWLEDNNPGLKAVLSLPVIKADAVLSASSPRRESS